jgi:hypothetical protein
MTYLILADLLVLVHLLFIIFVLLGGLLLMLHGSLIFVHLPAVIWAALISFKGWICPLTPLENHLRRVAGSADYEQGFVEHYLIPIIYPSNLTPNIQVMLGIFVLLINLSIYCFVYYKRMAKHGGKRG